MGVFVTVQINSNLCPKGCSVCVETCSVKIFAVENEKVVINPANEEECTLCDMCIERCPKEAIKLIKNY
jgi:NAD-dependent dihydropyrimidine dehydrogenase PreA subunit